VFSLRGDLLRKRGVFPPGRFVPRKGVPSGQILLRKRGWVTLYLGFGCEFFCEGCKSNPVLLGMVIVSNLQNSEKC
jgi:hypothetical protein